LYLCAGQGWPSVPVAKDGEKGPSRKYINVSLGFLIVEKKGEARGKSRRTV